MEAAHKIREAVARVSQLRQAGRDDATLRASVIDIKRVQARRFSGTYADLLRAQPYASASRFFLEELYSDKDFEERDAQFAKIASAIETLFPKQVAQTAIALAELHALTEELDFGMAQAWREPDVQRLADPARYILAWRKTGRRPERERQLRTVLAIGEEMARLTRTPGLRLMLKMMRGPASAAGLSSLQRFLESGFDTFAGMAKQRGAVETFLRLIGERETALLASLFDAELVACETEFTRILGQAP